MPQVKRQAPSPTAALRRSPDPNTSSVSNSLTISGMMMAGNRSIISVGAKSKATPFGSITAEESAMLKRTLADRRRAWAQPGTEPLSRERTLAILRRKEKRSVMISELLQFALYTLVYISAVLMQRPILWSHDLESAIESVFVKQTVSQVSGGFAFEEISSHADVFTWMHEVFLPVVYADTWYNGDDSDDLDEHTIGAQTVFVGGFRLLQIRGGEGQGSHCYESVWSKIQPRCLDDEESQATYGPGTEGFTYACDPSDEDVCGFYIDFAIGNHTFVDQVNRLEKLKTGRWLDEQTRYLYIDTSMYNNNYKLWTRVALVVHFDLAGESFESEEIEVLIVDPYELSTGIDGVTFFRMLLELIFILIFIKTTNDERHEYIAAGSFRAYMDQYGWLNNIGDALSILLNLLIVAFWIRLIALPQRLQLTRKADDAESSFDTYFELSELARWDEHYIGINAANIVLQTFRSLRFFQVTTQGERLTHTLKSLAPELCTFVPIFTVVIIGYAISGMVFFGMDYETWSTPGQAIFNVWGMNFGLYNTTSHVGGNFGVMVFVYSSLIIIAIIFMNVFLAMVMTAWEDLDQLDEEHEYLIPVPQSLLENDLPMMLHIPTSVITTVIEQMPAMVDGHEKEEMTPDELEAVMNKAKVTEKQQDIFSRWFWAHPTKAQLLKNSPPRSDERYAANAPQRRTPRNRKHRRHLSEDMNALRELHARSQGDVDQETGAKPRVWLVAELYHMRQRHVWLKELCHFVLFWLVYVLAVFRERDTASMHSLDFLVEHTIVGLENNAGMNFDEIATLGDVFTWLDEGFIPTVYDDEWYNGANKELINQHTFGPGHTRMVGGWRILQERYSENGTSCYVGRFDRLRPVCVTDETEKGAYGPGNTTAAPDPEDDAEIFGEIAQSFRYSCSDPLGRDQGDDDCGYISQTTFANNSGLLQRARAKVAMLKKYRWLDRQTKAVRIGMTLYNENLKRWVSVEMILEVSLAGGVKSSHSVDVLHLSPFDAKDWSAQVIFDLVLQVAFVILTLIYVLDAAQKLKYTATPIQRARFEANTMTRPVQFVLELICLVLNLAVIFKWIYFLSMDFSELESFDLSGEEKATGAEGSAYPDVTSAVDWEKGWTSLNGANVMLQTLRGITYFQLSQNGRRLVTAIQRSGPQLANFIPIYIVVMMGFAFSGHLMFGIRDGDWSYFSYAFYNVFQMQLNMYSAYNVYDKSRWSVVWIYSLMLLSVVILTNVFVAIIMATWDEIDDELDAEQHKVPTRLLHDLKLLAVPPLEWKKAADALEDSAHPDAGPALTESEVVTLITPVVPKHATVILSRLFEQDPGRDGVISMDQQGTRDSLQGSQGNSGGDSTMSMEENLAAISFSPPTQRQQQSV